MIPQSMLPRLALSVRQPWAWAIIHAGKNIENRNWHNHAPNYKDAKRLLGTQICIHAAQGMTKAEYKDAAQLITRLHGGCPAPDELVRGAIIGAVHLAEIVRKSHSPWFFGSIGLVLAHPEPTTPVRAGGELGFFAWKPSEAPWPETAKWMLPKQEAML